MIKQRMPDGWVVVRGLVAGPASRVAAFPGE
jgi:hypothetical protein